MKKTGFLYQKVYEEIKADIKSGVSAPGSRLSSEKQLAAKYDISPITVKTALKLLAAEGYIKRIPGRGTFVTENVAEIVNNLPQPQKVSVPDMERHPVIGVVFEHVSSPYGLDMMYHMDRVATEKGYKLCIRFSYTDQVKETEEIDFLLALGVCGLIIMPSHGEHYNTKILKLLIDGFPVVLIDKNLDGIPVPAVYTDNEKCAGMLVDHLVGRGYANIGLVTSSCIGISSIEERERGFYERVSASGLKIYEECPAELKVDSICNTGRSIAERNIKTISEYLKKYPTLDSLVCLESGFLCDIYEACQRLEMRIPEDLAVCSFDEDNNSPTGYFFTHVKQDEIAISEKAMELIDCLINGQNGGKIKNYKIPGIFREGNTVRQKL